VLTALARLWLIDVPVDWVRFSAGERRRKVSLPTYPFERKRYSPFGAPVCGRPAADPAVPEGHERPELANGYAAPRTELEQVVAETWGELLGYDRVGIHDDFLLLGGDSLLTAQLVTRLEERFPIVMSFDEAFALRTVADQAEAVERLLLARLDELSDEDAQRLATGSAALDGGA